MIGLVSCSSSKRAFGRWAARELYTSPLFRKSLAHALQHCKTVYVLSAKHHLVELDQVLETYDYRIPASKTEQARWGREVARSLEERHGRDIVLYLLAGDDYARPIIRATHHWWPEDGGWREHVLQPLFKQPLGERLRWLNHNTK